MAEMHQVKGGNLNVAPETADQDELQESMRAFIKRLADEAKRRVDRRQEVEQRWLEDLRQYHGIYDDKTLSEFNRRTEGPKSSDKYGSRVFQNVTRPKTNALMARLWDLLFPTEDRNWGISPTPVPELQEEFDEKSALAIDAEDTRDDARNRLEEVTKKGDQEQQRTVAAEVVAAETVLSEAQAAADELHERIQEASRRADLMEKEIHDQLVHCRYAAEARDVIEDACKLGTGIMKGPVLGETFKTRYVKEEGQQGATIYRLTQEPSDMPAAYRVDPWSFFPDPDQRHIANSHGFLERHLMNKSQMRKLAKRPDIDEDAVRNLLRGDPDKENNPTYLTELNNITERSSAASKEFYQVWEYTGPIEMEDLELLAEHFEKPDTIEAMDDLDPLVEIHAKVWFCQDEVLSFALHPLDSQEPIYSAFSLEHDEAGPWGYGIPYIMRHSQSIINAAQRMMMDNAGLATGPQIVMNREAIEPANGSWELTPRKVWIAKNANNQSGQSPFDIFNIDMNQTELANIITMERQTVDEITSMPSLAQGEQGADVTKTAQGMAILMNSANVIFRRVVKNYDDDLSVPMIRRFYHWNMQFSEKDEIKGDYEVDARGASVLLVREMQAQNLMIIAERFGDHPIYGKRINHDNLLAEIFRAHMIRSEEITLTRQEQEEQERREAQRPNPAVAVEEEKIKVANRELDVREREVDLKAEIANLEWNTKREIAELSYEFDMHELAEKLNMKAEDVEAAMERVRSERNDRANAARITAESAERRIATEAAMKERTGDSSGGAI